ncbi:glycosyltransferase family 4 protein [Thermococcus sp. 21S7]|uniref:glycosyltransferase family 4 protein n=1 Tax=Thermococcus sp. 21S7 TaxID=1638221 RepID=UPI001438B3E2|nr:glycosyltransferase family 4 protein [Thermococcus sp. 21S7]NJE62095.1 glycosyltransferase [Thermococcus sp. 21S7]
MSTTSKKIAVIINPIRGDILHPKKGGDLYVRYIVDKFIENGFDIIILSPACSSSKNKKISCYKFSTIKGAGTLMLGLNISYLVRLTRAIRKTRSRVQLVLNGPFGAISTYFLSRILRTKMIYIAHNVEKDRYSEKSVFEHEAKLLWVLSRIVPIFEDFAVKADSIISISPTDKKRFVEKYNIRPEKIMVYPPIGFNYQPVTRAYNKVSTKVIFHGSYKYLPNKEAMEIIRGYLSKRIPYKNVRFLVFGSGSPKIHEETFRSVGFIEDIYKFLSSCDIAIVPLKRGAGVKLKMLDYMTVGLPIVTTKKGAEGLELVNGKHAIIVDDVNENFVRAIKYLIENPKIRRKLGHNTKKLVMLKYSGG